MVGNEAGPRAGRLPKGAVSRMKTISVGVIGWGFMGKTHAQALRSIALFYPCLLYTSCCSCWAAPSASAMKKR